VKKARIENTKYKFSSTKVNNLEREKRWGKAILERQDNLRKEIDKIPLVEETRFEMLWNILKATYKMVKTLYYIFKILTLLQTLKENKVSKDKLTTTIGIMIGAIITLLTIWFGIKIPPEISQLIIAGLAWLVMYIWKPKEKPKE